MIKAKAIAFILDNAAIEVNPLDWFGWNFCGWLTPKKVKAGPTKTMAPRDPSTVQVTELTEPEGIRDNLDPVYEQLVDAIEGAELKIKPEQTLIVVKVMEAAFESHETKQVIHLDI